MTAERSSVADGASSFIHSAADAARWVAFQRANESARSDAVITDPFAARFIGPRPPRSAAVDCRVAFRSASIDRLITQCVAARRIDAVLNLGAGFDARPQRLRLPASLRWIDVDSASVLAEKAAVLADAPSHCVVERVVADLADEGDRSWLDRIRSARTLVVTEGVLVYLKPAQVTALARDLRAAEVVAWITDVASPLFVASYRRTASADDLLGRLVQFAPADPIGVFAQCGFRCYEVVAVDRVIERAGRARPFADAPEPLRQLLLDASGILALEGADHP